MNGLAVHANLVYEFSGEYPAFWEGKAFFKSRGTTLRAIEREFVIELVDYEEVIKVSEGAPGSFAYLSAGYVQMNSDHQLSFHIGGRQWEKIVIGKNYVPHFRAYLRERIPVEEKIVAEELFENVSGSEHPIRVAIFEDSVLVEETDTFIPWSFRMTYGEAAHCADLIRSAGVDNKLEMDEALGYVDKDGDLAFHDTNDDECLFIAESDIPSFVEFLQRHCSTLPSELFSPNPEVVETVRESRGPQFETTPETQFLPDGREYQDYEGKRYIGGLTVDKRFCSGWEDHELDCVSKCVHCETLVVDIPSGLDIANPKDRIGQTKLDLGEFPTIAIVEGALAMEQGALKYGRRNFRYADVKASVYIAALKRHIHKYESGEDYDADTDGQVHHLGSVEACAAILLDAAHHGTLIDDREFSEFEADHIDEAQERVEALRRKYGSDKRLLEDRNA